MIAVSSKNQVVPLPILGEIFNGVINNMIGAKRTDHVHLARAAHGSDFSAERFGNLYRKRAYPTRGAVDQYLLPRLNMSFVAETLQGGNSRQRHSRRLFK